MDKEIQNDICRPKLKKRKALADFSAKAFLLTLFSMKFFICRGRAFPKSTELLLH